MITKNKLNEILKDNQFDIYYKFTNLNLKK